MPKDIGGLYGPSLSFNKHSQYVAERVSGRNNILKALAGTSWGQQKKTLLMTYKAVGRSIINYATPFWSPNLHNTNYRNGLKGEQQPRTNKSPSSNHTYTKSTPNHIHHHYAPSVTLTYTTHIISSTSPTYTPHCHPWICGQTPLE